MKMRELTELKVLEGKRLALVEAIRIVDRLQDDRDIDRQQAEKVRSRLQEWHDEIDAKQEAWA